MLLLQRKFIEANCQSLSGNQRVSKPTYIQKLLLYGIRQLIKISPEICGKYHRFRDSESPTRPSYQISSHLDICDTCRGFIGNNKKRVLVTKFQRGYVLETLYKESWDGRHSAYCNKSSKNRKKSAQHRTEYQEFLGTEW